MRRGREGRGQSISQMESMTHKIYLRRRINSELELGLLPVVDGEALHEQGGESRPCASTEGVKDEESLEPSALVSQLSNTVQHQVHHLFAYKKRSKIVSQFVNICVADPHRKNADADPGKIFNADSDPDSCPY
jgi:hypothetical protein